MCVAPAFHQALRCAFRTDCFKSIRHYAHLQVPANKPHHPFILNLAGNSRHQYVVVDTVEELLQIDIHDPAISLFYVFPRLYHCLMGATPPYEAVTVRRKLRDK